jgi:hypothetical protein
MAGGPMGDGQFKAFRRLIAHLENFDFDARCEIAEFTLMRLNKREDPVIATNAGSAYNDKVANMVAKAAPGDNYLFREIKARCPGDIASRKIPDLVVNIR